MPWSSCPRGAGRRRFIRLYIPNLQAAGFHRLVNAAVSDQIVLPCVAPGQKGCGRLFHLPARTLVDYRGYPAGRRVRQTAAVACNRGKSGLRRTGSWVTPRRGDPTESAAETRPPMARRAQARVKRWCKRPPASRETGVAGKPLPEQGRAEAPAVRRSSLGWTAPRPDGNAGPRWMAVARQRVQNPAYRRTRLPPPRRCQRRERPPKTPPPYPTAAASPPNSSSVQGPAGLPPARLRAATTP